MEDSAEQVNKLQHLLRLTCHEIHIWRITLNQPSAQVFELFNILATDERARAQRFCFDKHRRRFIVARGMLRQILSRYVRVEPQNIQFGYGDKGKPFLRGHIPPNVQFNLSHSDDVALLAVTADAEIGVDFEVIQPVCDTDCIAKQFFSASECAALQYRSIADSLEMFFNFWTRKEAFTKALGCGLSTPLDNFEVSLEPSEENRIQHSSIRADGSLSWSLLHWKPTSGSVAAVVVSTIPHEIVFYDA